MAEIPTEALEAAARARQEHAARTVVHDFAPRTRPIVDGEERSRGWYWKCPCGAHRHEFDLESGYASQAEAEAHENEAVLAAAAPYLIAEGRRQRDAELFTAQPDDTVDDETPALMARYERELRAKIAGEIRKMIARVPNDYPDDMRCAPWWNSLSGPTPEAFGEWAARIVEGLSPAERAERYLRESRQRQAGLDYERIERARAAQAGPGTQREV